MTTFIDNFTSFTPGPNSMDEEFETSFASSFSPYPTNPGSFNFGVPQYTPTPLQNSTQLQPFTPNEAGSNASSPLSPWGIPPAGSMHPYQRSLLMRDVYGKLASDEDRRQFLTIHHNFKPWLYGLPVPAGFGPAQGSGGSGGGTGGGSGVPGFTPPSGDPITGLDPATEALFKNLVNTLLSGGELPGNYTGIPSNLLNTLKKTLSSLLQGGGLPGNMLKDGENVLTEISKQRELNRVQAANDYFGGKGMLNSGLTPQAHIQIGNDETSQLLAAMNSLQLQGASLVQNAINAGISGTQGLGSLSHEGIAQAIASALGLGDLGLRGQAQSFAQAIQEAMLNLQLASLVFPNNFNDPTDVNNFFNPNNLPSGGGSGSTERPAGGGSGRPFFRI